MLTEIIDDTEAETQVLQPPTLNVEIDFPPTIPQEIQLYDEWRSAANWRRAQLSYDAFDKFRNLYLIVERIGKKMRGSNDPDRTVIKDTIETVANAQGLNLRSIHR